MNQFLFSLSSGIIVLAFLSVSLGMLIVPAKAIRYFSRNSLLTNAADASNQRILLYWRLCGLVMTGAGLFFAFLILDQAGVFGSAP